MQALRTSLIVAVASALAALAGCASRSGPRDDEPTLASLAGRSVAVAPDRGLKADPEQAIAAYRAFVKAAPDAPQRPEVLRRLGDLEMERVEARIAEGRAMGSKDDWRAAIALHRSVLQQYPKQPGNDRVLYQLARAHELGGDLDEALAMLDRLVVEHPTSGYRDEAHFRRGELLFTARRYADAERAYATVLAQPARTTFHERSLYMQGWSRFKQAKLDEALASFFGVLDLKLADAAVAAETTVDPDDDGLRHLSRGERELLDDTFRVTSLALQSLQGAASIEGFTSTPERRGYEVHVYRQLAEMYLKQERVKDAADTLSAFTRRHPLHPRSPQLQARVIAIYQGAGFATLALDAKRDHVKRYGVGSAYQRANPTAWQATAMPLVKAHLAELAQHHHALAQRAGGAAAAHDAAEAITWYRAWLEGFERDAEAPGKRFLLAELLQSQARWAEAATEFERTAYDSGAHARAADAGYAALLVRAEVEKRAGDDAARLAAAKAVVASSLRFAETFKADARATPVLGHASEKLFALGQPGEAATVAQRVLDASPQATPELRRVAHTVIAHAAFDRAAFAQAEQHYTQALALIGIGDAARAPMVERQAAAIYKQGEAARAGGKAGDAAAHFARVASVAPQSAVRANAQVDAAAAMIEARDWAGAARQLEDFRQRFPNHALGADVTTKLAHVYSEQQQWGPAAAEFERLAASSRDSKLAREAQWRAAELHERAGAKAAATKAYERYVAQHPQPAAPALEARWRVMSAAKEAGQTPRVQTLAREIVQADGAAGPERTDRTKTLAALASLELAQGALDAYRKVALVEPLQKQLATKKARLEDVLQAYAAASAYGVAEGVTAATFHTAELYQDFGRALLTSQRPKKLSKLEREQYDVMLEEQAFPFEEKALALHETNARRTTDGLWDAWIGKSHAALRALRPVRWGKLELKPGVIDAIR